MVSTNQATEPDQANSETAVVTDGGSQKPCDPAKALLEDAAGL